MIRFAGTAVLPAVPVLVNQKVLCYNRANFNQESVLAMELHEKLQDLRKRAGLTQEELAEQLYVSRTAISKWESGRGYPNIDSLKALAKYFRITIDELLSGEELLCLAEKDSKQKEHHLRDLVFGLLDCSTAIFFVLPLFGQNIDGITQAVSLLRLSEVSSYIRVAYFAAITGIILWGLLILALQNYPGRLWELYKQPASLVLNAISVLLFMISSQPYASSLLFLFLAIKTIMVIKRR